MCRGDLRDAPASNLHRTRRHRVRVARHGHERRARREHLRRGLLRSVNNTARSCLQEQRRHGGHVRLRRGHHRRQQRGHSPDGPPADAGRRALPRGHGQGDVDARPQYSLSRGTAIATFDTDPKKPGKYANNPSGNHAAYFLHAVDGGFRVLEQVSGHVQMRDVIGGPDSGYYHNPRAYSVIMRAGSGGSLIEIKVKH